MYCIKLTLQPTAGMTFRILPGSILNIATYPFVPPTTLSGFLRRLGMLSVGLELPETRINKEKPPTYTLPPRYTALGAYPTPGSWHGVHRTYRKGMREFNHDSFSKIYQEKDRANFQLHTWEYLIAEELTGYVVADTPEGLEHFQDLEAYGCKLGKEGFAFVSGTSDVLTLQSMNVAAIPSTILPMEALLQSNPFVGGCDIYNLYRYQQTDQSITESDREGFLDTQPSSVEGFVPFVAGYFSSPLNNPPTLDYYTDQEDIYIPAALIELLRGEVHA
ncbi:hypothetical protein [Leptothoe spongobia]|uniref:Uncharacterized protein n=1 Tax=Leptothoe spongobia TAU-MAC 1115 TaxID=1967444 RepID=A0A947DD83_9CYAN|nr:hypothetical protein [Leptothoe spongobia]MBT9314858.1 hypothetical protein [Leptothoe spongobia TAU-MAC 1115]